MGEKKNVAPLNFCNKAGTAWLLLNPPGIESLQKRDCSFLWMWDVWLVSGSSRHVSTTSEEADCYSFVLGTLPKYDTTPNNNKITTTSW